MTITYIVSFYDRVQQLNTCLASLGAQAHRSTSEIIVCCNSTDDDVIKAAQMACLYHDAHCELTGLIGARDCYESAEIIGAKGDWLCFPSDDSYYVPLFAERMLDAALMHEWDFVYCDMLYASKWTVPEWTYSVMDVRPVKQHIDKTCFIVRRGLFNGFPGKLGGAPCEADGALAEELVSRGVRHGKANGGALVVHN